MKEKSIKLSPKHGVNPSLIKCPICGKEYGVALFGRLKGDVEAPKEVTGEPCDDCQKKFVSVIEIGEDGPTGRIVAVPREAIAIEVKGHYVRMLKEEFEKIFCNTKTE